MLSRGSRARQFTPPSPASQDCAACRLGCRERRRCGMPAAAAAPRARGVTARRSSRACGSRAGPRPIRCGCGVGKHEQLTAARLRTDIACAGLSFIRPCWTMEFQIDSGTSNIFNISPSSSVRVSRHFMRAPPSRHPSIRPDTTGSRSESCFRKGTRSFHSDLPASASRASVASHPPASCGCG